MSSKAYYVSHEGQQQGPFPLQDIASMVKGGQLTALDYLYDEGKADWVVILEHPELSQMIKEHKPKAPPQAHGDKLAQKETQKEEKQIRESISKMEKKGEPVGEHMVTEWYVLKGENKFGPFAYTDLVKMLQQKVVFEFDFVWHPGLSTWKRIAELSAFEQKHVQGLKDTLMPEIAEVFFRRRHRRVNYNATVLIHDNKTVWKGTGVEISAGGAGVVMENALITPGQTLYLHFKPGDGVPPFNAVCEVVSKKYVEGVRDKDAPIRYGLKFTSLSPNTQKFLQDYTKKGEAA